MDAGLRTKARTVIETLVITSSRIRATSRPVSRTGWCGRLEQSLEEVSLNPEPAASWTARRVAGVALPPLSPPRSRLVGIPWHQDGPGGWDGESIDPSARGPLDVRPALFLPC